MRLRRAATAGFMSVLLLAGCSGGGDASDETPTTSDAPAASRAAPSEARSYVALGDSYTAGPRIEPQQADAGLCQRSAKNWPTLLAATLQVDLTDVSCSGATTADLASTEASGAVSSGTDIVTVSAGGNDGGLFLSLIRACTSGADACGTFVDQQAPPILEQTTTDLAALLAKLRSDAPSATVVLVGYPRIMPESGTCETVGIDAADAASVLTAEKELDDALAAAADQAGVTYVSPLESSTGHDACAGDQAWTNGTSPAAGDGILFHPNRKGMAAVAALVATAIDR